MNNTDKIRENGFYWVKPYSNSQWTAAQWIARGFAMPGVVKFYTDDRLHQIDENRIDRNIPQRERNL